VTTINTVVTAVCSCSKKLLDNNSKKCKTTNIN